MVWKSKPNANVIRWLLESNNPSVKYYTLRDIIGLKESDLELRTTRKEIVNSTIVKAILGAQKPEGYWGAEDDIYYPKYTATTHQLLILAEHGTPKTAEIGRAIEHVYRFQRNSGHFLVKLPKTEKSKSSTVKDGCCIDGNILFYLVHFGYLQDPRTRRLLLFIYNYYDREDSGWHCRAYPIDPKRVFPANCYMGATKILKAFSTIPEQERDPEMRKIIELEVEKILENSVYKYLRNPDGSRKDKAGWKRFGFPLFYNADVLEILDTLARLKVHDDRMGDAISLVLNARQPDGRWLLKHSFNGSFTVDIEAKSKPSKWITLRAMRILKEWSEY